jgi:hypothetical protein
MFRYCQTTELLLHLETSAHASNERRGGNGNDSNLQKTERRLALNPVRTSKIKTSALINKAIPRKELKKRAL